MDKSGQTSEKRHPAIKWLMLLVILAGTIYGVITALDTPVNTTAVAKEVSVSQAAALRGENAFILDVRESDEWAAGHIPGATLIPLGQLESRLSEVPQDQQIVVVCRSGNRSATGRDILLDAGFTDVSSMGGGMNAWISQGLETVTGP